MRLLIVLFVAGLSCFPSFAQDAVLTVYPEGNPKIQYATRIELYSGEQLTQESEVAFAQGSPASIITGRHTRRGKAGVPGGAVYESIGGLILAGSADCVFSKPEYMSDWLWEGVWQNAQHLSIGELEFYVFAPGSDRIVINVDRWEHSLKVTRDKGEVDLEVVNNKSFYGSLEMPFHCNAIGTPMYMYTLKGFNDGELAGETETFFTGGIGARSTQLCRSADESVGIKRVIPSCLMLVADKDITGLALGNLIVGALDGHKMPPLNTATLGQFAFYYYYPEYDELEITLSELEGGYSDDWQGHSKFLGRMKIANNQPMPPIR